MESYSRVRSVKLRRNRLEDSFGFTVRGGQEHGTGVFVSSVTPRSIAYRQGLKIGDQILRVNGYPVSLGTHGDCLALIRARAVLSLKIRSVGMIPVREGDEPLTWRLVENIHSTTVGEDEIQRRAIDSPASTWDSQGQEVKVCLTNGESGLGCCICRGPPERPGIFIQSTKSNGVAREASLRPGDQIVQCNGVSFRQIQFSEAVRHLKANRELRLVVIKGVASDLFPGESSGYNSSASSINGETITTHISVRSESSNSSDEIVSRGGVTPEQSGEEKMRSRVSLDRHMEWNEVEKAWNSAVAPPPPKESLIIEIKGENPVEKVRMEELRLAEERRRLEEEQKKLEEEKIRFEEEKRRIMEKVESERSSSALSSEIPLKQYSPHGDLAGALTNAILKRTERRELQQKELEQDGKESPVTGGIKIPLSPPFTPTLVDDTKRQQHERLIEEFKRAHRKMFAPTSAEDNKNSAFPPKEERASFRAKRIQKEVEHARKMVENRVAGIVKQRQLRIERQHQEVQETEREVSKRVTGKPEKMRAPPPPPPANDAKQTLQHQRCSTLSSAKFSSSAPSEIFRNGTKLDNRPESPLPDYSNSPSPELNRRQRVRVEPHQIDDKLSRLNLNGISQLKNGEVRILVNGEQQRTNSVGGILKKNSSLSGSEHSSSSHNLKTISFGPF